jgi:hypothetical protein
MELTTLQTDIRAHHKKAQDHAGKAIEHAFKAGELLLEAKEQAGHGNWLSFLDGTGVNARTAQRYMKLAKNQDKLKNDSVSHLSVTQALAHLVETKHQIPPELSECLHHSDEMLGKDRYVWRFDNDYFHFLILIQQDDDEVFIEGGKRAVSWKGIESAFPDIDKFEKSGVETLDLAISLRGMMLPSPNCGPNYNPQKPYESLHVNEV